MVAVEDTDDPGVESVLDLRLCDLESRLDVKLCDLEFSDLELDLQTLANHSLGQVQQRRRLRKLREGRKLPFLTDS